MSVDNICLEDEPLENCWRCEEMDNPRTPLYTRWLVWFRADGFNTNLNQALPTCDTHVFQTLRKIEDIQLEGSLTAIRPELLDIINRVNPPPIPTAAQELAANAEL